MLQFVKYHLVFNFTRELVQIHRVLRVTLNLYVLNELENCHTILEIATHDMIKFIILVKNIFLITLHKAVTKLLKKKHIRTKDSSKFVKTQKRLPWLKFAPCLLYVKI